MTPAPGFYKRLATACKAHDIDEYGLARAIERSVEYVRELFQTDVAWDVKAVTMFRIADRTGFSSRWLLTGKGSCAVRREATPDDQWLLNRYNEMTTAQRDRINEAIKRILFRKTG